MKKDELRDTIKKVLDINNPDEIRQSDKHTPKTKAEFKRLVGERLSTIQDKVVEAILAKERYNTTHSIANGSRMQETGDRVREGMQVVVEGLLREWNEWYKDILTSEDFSDILVDEIEKLNAHARNTVDSRTRGRLWIGRVEERCSIQAQTSN